jgi:hypothetical protein
MMNCYRTEFFAICSNNGIRIRYSLVIKTDSVIEVEAIIKEIDSITIGFHEELADHLFDVFGGVQTMIANHHSVEIETIRGLE